MKEDFVKGLFEQCGIVVLGLMKISNQYWPDCDRYREIRDKNPWWIVQTKVGPIVFGHRKRVFEVDWNLSTVRLIVTEDEVTKSETLVHAYDLPHLAQYLTRLGEEIYRIVRAIEGRQHDIEQALAAYVKVCGNTGAVFSRESAKELYELATQALEK